MKHDLGKSRSAGAKPVRVHGVDTGAADFVRRKRTAVVKRVVYLTIFLVVLVGGLGYFQPPSTEISVPVIWLPADEQRKVTSAAKSSGLAAWPDL